MPISIVGNGSITGLTAGGLPDGSVVDLDLATGISSSKLTGALPVLDGSSLTGVGVDGIVSSANATAITIDSNENIGIGAGSPSSPALGASGTTHRILEIQSSTGAAGIVLNGNSGTHDAWDIFVSGGRLDIKDNDVLRLRLESDGRGLSQFTAKAWANYNQVGTPSIRDSHNVSSLSDQGTGDMRVMFTNNMANTNYVGFMNFIRDSTWTATGTEVRDKTTSYARCRTIENSSSYDNALVDMLIFGD